MSKERPRRTFDDVLEKIRKESKNTVDLGTKFERLMFDFFKTDSLYKQRFTKVWMWSDWARDNKIKEKLGTGHDLGIDLVAEGPGGELYAIQCKCHDDDTVLGMDPINSFVSAGTTYKMSHYVLVCTGPINGNAMTKLRGVRCSILDTAHLRNSSMDWSVYPKLRAKDPKKLRDYQVAAMEDVIEGFKNHQRGKMIMACGTGKTLVSLRIAEELAGKGGTVLYLVPSISLILQSMREWSDNATIPHYYMAVCSDKSVRNSEEGTLTELETPASTDPKELAEKLDKVSRDTMNVIFSTYHSIEVVMKTMKKDQFDLVLCDEAHRTTGIDDKGKESYLAMVHHERNIRARRRLYMTATPRIYTDHIKSKAKQKEKEVISMDNEDLYGPEFHNLSFYDAVHKYQALSDFKVRVAIMDGDTMDKMIQHSVADDESHIPLNEKTLMTSVWHALEYPGADDEKALLQRVIVFCDMINSSKLFAGEELDYKKDIREDPEKLARAREIDANRAFVELIKHIKNVKDDKTGTTSEVRHVDGGDNAQTRRKELDWLRDSADDPNTCRMLSNARCLSEGVDVPALDGVVFMNPRKSVVDVVQAVGRVMRKSPGKEYGYVVLPVAIPAGVNVEDALSDSKYFKVVWQVLNALRSHDPNLAEEINRLVLEPPTGKDNEITNRIIIRHAGSHNLYSLDMPADQMIQGISTKLVEKVGDAEYYDKFGKDIGRAAMTIETRIKNKLSTSPQLQNRLKDFHQGLCQVINDDVTEDDAVRVIGQHIVMSRVFNALFADEFASYNPISKILDKMANRFELEEELEILEPFYERVKHDIFALRNGSRGGGRQELIRKVYSNFFASAAKKETEQHGIVYTPDQIIDFIINSVQVLLKKHFGTSFDHRDVKVLEPFAGTGTFVSKLLESGYIKDNLYKKYKNDIFANEMILLAYYIAAVNIETTYTNVQNNHKYVPFEGISYTDTIKHNARYLDDPRHRKEPTKINEDFESVHERIRYQRKSHVDVIIGNPPYSMGQDDSNKNTPNKSYPEVDDRIQLTYADRVKKINSDIQQIRSLYDSYIRSIRWVSDRIGKSGIIGFVINASFIRTDVTAGLRACLEEEFDEIWCFDLRGNQRTKGEISKKEGGKIFGSDSRTPVAILILIKNPTTKKCVIHYKDIGDYLTREEKLEKIHELESIDHIKNWHIVKPDKHYDWLDQRNPEFTKYTPMGNKKAKSNNAIFYKYSNGLSTSRDVWTYNSSKPVLSKNMKMHIDYCNSQDLRNFKSNPRLAKRNDELIKKLFRFGKQTFDESKIRTALYRPFFKQYLYFDHIFNTRLGIIPYAFPESYSKNLVICIPYKSIEKFSTFVTEITLDLEMIHHGQCFPLYIYENKDDKKSNITDITLREYQKHYGNKKITKKSIFYYIYGLLHHDSYKEKFANNLLRELPHIPMAPDFWKFSKAGEKLVDLHLNYDKCSQYDLGKPKARFGNLEKMNYSRMKKDGKQTDDKTKLKINGIEVYDNIPTIKYQVNGRTPLEWLIDRYRPTTDKDSGITNDPTKGMTEQKTIQMIERILYVGTESDKIITDLSKLPFEPKDWKPKKSGMDEFLDGDTPARSKL